jgi:hypothetical protein
LSNTINKFKNEISLIKVNQIEKNNLLEADLPKRTKTIFKQLISDYGNVFPAIVTENINNDIKTYKLQDPISGLYLTNLSNIQEIPSVIVHTDNEIEELKLTLYFLLTNSNASDAISESIIIDKLHILGLTYKQLIEFTGKSKSYISKRLNLAKNLSDGVKLMVSNKAIYPRTAEEISKLPKEVQVEFAVKVSKDGINKEDVTELVKLYNDDSTTIEQKEQIILRPNNVCTNIIKSSKKRSNDKNKSNDKNENNDKKPDFIIINNILHTINRLFIQLNELLNLDNIKDNYNLISPNLNILQSCYKSLSQKIQNAQK